MAPKIGETLVPTNFERILKTPNAKAATKVRIIIVDIVLNCESITENEVADL